MYTIFTSPIYLTNIIFTTVIIIRIFTVSVSLKWDFTAQGPCVGQAASNRRYAANDNKTNGTLFLTGQTPYLYYILRKPLKTIGRRTRSI